MMALPEKAIAPSVASSRPGQTGRGAATAEPAMAEEDIVRGPSATSVGCSLAVAARIARRDVALDRRVAEPPDELAGAEVLVAVVDDLDAMAPLGQPLHG